MVIEMDIYAPGAQIALCAVCSVHTDCGEIMVLFLSFMSHNHFTDNIIDT